MKKTSVTLLLVSIAAVAFAIDTTTAARKMIALDKPDMQGGIPLMQALAKRSSSRSFSPKALPGKVLSDLLWAADGINRPSAGKRTAPSAMNNHEIAVYVALPEGLYLYDAKMHSLTLIVGKDLRGLSGSQGFVKKAALNLIYVADLSMTAGNDKEDKILYAGADTGFIGQNVYLYCASAGLVTVIRGYIDREALGKAIGLKSSQMIILAQTVGYPAD